MPATAETAKPEGLFSAEDAWHMRHALRLAQAALGRTAENPAVGCVIVSNGQVVGTGATASGGRPHAEPQALAMAGERARGATAYVTLEPCAHHGHTPPCTEALIAAGISRVVAAMPDPDPRVNGGGLKLLAEAGIETAVGLLEPEARRLLAGFIRRHEEGRPQVLLKLAVSADGMIAAEPGAPTAITGALALRRAHLLRAQSDAILVGGGTIRADDPMLTCRLPGLEDRSPVRVVLSRALEGVPLDAKVFATADEVPTVVFCTPAGRDRALALKERHPAVRIVPMAADAEGDIPVQAVLGRLAEMKINRLMVEGGAQVARAFIEAGVVDEIALFEAPKKRLGPGGVQALAGLALQEVLAGYELTQEMPLGPDVLRRYERRQG